MVEPFTLEGGLTKWTNLVHGWQYRWLVLDVSVGVLFYYTSKQDRKRDRRRGSVKLKNAIIGIDDLDDSTFTITVDQKVFHFRARDSDERQKWLDAIEEARDLHSENYALLHQTKKLLDDSDSPTEFNRRVVEVDAYLQILIEQQQELSNLAPDDECPPEIVSSVNDRLQSLIELVKKTLVCLQFAREFASVSYSTVLTANSLSAGHQVPSGPRYSPTDAYSSPAQEAVLAARGTCRQEFSCFDLSGQSTEWPVSSFLQDDVCSGSRVSSQVPSQASGTLKKSSGQLASTPQLSTDNDDDDDDNDDDLLPQPGEIQPSNGYLDGNYDDDDDDEFFDTHEELDQIPALFNESGQSCGLRRSQRGDPTTSLSVLPDQLIGSATYHGCTPQRQMSSNNQSCGKSGGCASGSTGTAVSLASLTPADMHDELYDDNDEDELHPESSHGSLVAHLVKQLRIGMDLTRITLPTYILERRSTLEMYGDFLAHADLWAAIPDANNPRDRMVACLRWYLSAFHAGRRSSVAKKPYNPILGEVFKCYWSLPEQQTSAHQCDPSRQWLDTSISQMAGELLNSSPVPWAPRNSVTFIAEQVSHHPPISAFYVEHIDKRMCIDGYLWTKSKYLGMSIGVEMVGEAVISLLALDEEYTVTFPWGYGKGILGVPWIELGGTTSITCPKTGYTTTVEFKQKPFIGGKKHIIRAEAFAPNAKKPFLVVEGEWNNKMWAHWDDGKEELFFDTVATPTLKKYVLPRSLQSENESRRLWENVTSNLKLGNVEAATEAKRTLEDAQRQSAQQRKKTQTAWVPVHFRGEGDGWVYRNPLIQRAEPVA